MKKKELDPLPRVILVPGVGMFGVGASAKDAAIAADIAENAIAVITDAEAIGEYRSISEFDMFEVEYWSLEQAKLGKSNEKSLARQVAVITGGGSGIGAATAKAMAKEGAEIAILDRDEDAARAAAKKIGGKALAIACDVTDPASVKAAFDKVVSKFGGVDIVVSNAGAAWQGAIGKVDDETLRKSFELNFWSHQSVAQNAVRIMQAPGHVRLPAVQHLQAGGQSGQGFRALRIAQGGHPVPGQAICPGSRQGRHPQQCGQCRPHPHAACSPMKWWRRAPRRGASPRMII